ncbi:hypothetical protein PCANC_08792 [Puccinia coronata f. sp. avenae]|uniref:Uncharacterized protein n=1 Tax=Puccinia coronata f. sp. avenae TaxID=200324 RepID=A0A2N5V863_9BASI|nr:hypothetical protein PCANC_08792 [Puccinia coronata f. sp. avenae]
MVKEINKLKWSRFKGKTKWIQCFAHILNLIVQRILCPFGTHRKKSTGINTTLVDPISSSDEEDNAGGQIEILACGEELTVFSNDNSSDGDSVGQVNKNDLESLVEEDIQNGSDEDEGDLYTSASCKQSLAKFHAIAKKS